MNVLYIEDDPDIAEVYTHYLHSNFEGMKVHHFIDGHKAFLELSSNLEKFSLVISDYYMPGKDGGEIFKFVNGQMLGIPFIILSGHDCSRDDNFRSFFQTHVRNAFLLKPCPPEEFVEKVKWCLEAESDKLKIYSKPATDVDEKIPVNPESFIKLNSIACDVYLKLGAEKFVKVINKNDLFSTEVILKLIAKGVKYFFINKSELSHYGESVTKSVHVMLVSKNIKMDDVKKSQMTGQALDIVKSNLMKCGFSPAIFEVTEEIINIQMDMIKRSPELSGFMEKFQLFRRMNTEHSRLVCFLCTAILKEIGWDSESTLHKMCLASLFHDISLPEEFGNKLSASEYVKTLADADKKNYELHCEESAHLSKNFSSLAEGIEQVILEHHELPDGSGFPKKLTAMHVHALSACLHLADFVADLMWQHNFDINPIKLEIFSKKEFYSKGVYRKPYDTIIKVLNK